MKKAGYLGCDVSKGHCDFLLLASDEKVISCAFNLDDTNAGRAKLKELIDNWLANDISTLYCGVESTGGYENNWFQFFKILSKDLPIKVARLNPKGVKAVGDASLIRTSTDAVSAENIALYLKNFPKKVDYGADNSLVISGEFAEGRQHNTYIKMLIKQKVQLSNQLEKLIYQHFSEMVRFCRHGVPGWLLRLLVKFPCAKEVLKAGEQRVGDLFGIGPNKAKALVTKSKSSTQLISKQVQHIIRVTAEEIIHKQYLIEKEQQYLQEIHQENEQVKFLCTIKGIGVNSAITILLEIADINRFATAKKLASYFGINPEFKESGDGVWGCHLSKKGRGEIRGVLYMASLAGIRWNPLLKALYIRFRAKGMKHYQAMGVVMHKLLRIIFGMLKNKIAFDETIDQKNTAKANEKQKEHEALVKIIKKQNLKSLNRYKNFSEEAPISRKKYQKNKKAFSVPIAD